MHSYKIRPIELEDNNDVAAIIRKVMPQFNCVGEGYSINDPEVDAMYQAYDNDRSAFYVVEDEKSKKLMGCGGIAPLKGGDSHICELQKMYFLSALRGLGMGQKLLDICVGQAFDIGYTHCYLETVSRMTAANGLYQKNEFKQLDAQIGHTGHSACDSYYVKELKPNRPFAQLF